MNRESVETLARAALQNLEAHRRRIDDLNVYPVPDGDTGTNLVLTVRGVVDALERTTTDDLALLAREASKAALLAARGNSGVILSQVVRGFAEAVAANGDPPLELLARAFRSASDAAYRAVREPVEGTMLTVVRELAEEAEERARDTATAADLLRALVERGEAALARTPELLGVLRDAGVVDAGGAGVVEIVRGIALAVAGEPLPEAEIAPAELALDGIHQELSRYRYCTTFVIEGAELDPSALERDLERLGDSLLVVGDASALKVHVHTDDPGAALSRGTAAGVIGGVEIANMHRQAAAREERLLSAPSTVALRCGLVAVCQGAGSKRLFEGLGATIVLEGGQTMNPSAAEIVAAVEAVPAAEVIVLPNNANVLMAAEQAAELASKEVHVVPCRSVQAGLVATVAFVPINSVDENARAMDEALQSVVTGEVATASRDAELEGLRIRKGAYVGLVGETAVAAGEDLPAVALAVAERLLATKRSSLFLLTGEEAPALDGLLETLRAAHPGLEVEVNAGGQPHYPLLLAAE